MPHGPYPPPPDPHDVPGPCYTCAHTCTHPPPHDVPGHCCCTMCPASPFFASRCLHIPHSTPTHTHDVPGPCCCTTCPAFPFCTRYLPCFIVCPGHSLLLLPSFCPLTSHTQVPHLPLNPQATGSPTTAGCSALHWTPPAAEVKPERERAQKPNSGGSGGRVRAQRL